MRFKGYLLLSVYIRGFEDLCNVLELMQYKHTFPNITFMTSD